MRITAEIRSRITALADLAPLHNPPSLETLAAAEAELPKVPHVAVFDTAFHATLSPEAYTYPLPEHWTRDWGIRRYGFHGLSHAYCARRAAVLMGKPPEPVEACGLSSGTRLLRVGSAGRQKRGHHHGLHASGRPDDGDTQRLD